MSKLLILLVVVFAVYGCTPLTYEQKRAINETSETNKQSLKDISDDFAQMNSKLASPFHRWGITLWR